MCWWAPLLGLPPPPPLFTSQPARHRTPVPTGPLPNPTALPPSPPSPRHTHPDTCAVSVCQLQKSHFLPPSVGSTNTPSALNVCGLRVRASLNHVYVFLPARGGLDGCRAGGVGLGWGGLQGSRTRLYLELSLKPMTKPHCLPSAVAAAFPKALRPPPPGPVPAPPPHSPPTPTLREAHPSAHLLPRARVGHAHHGLHVVKLHAVLCP